jgi:hypothetical protein
MKPISASYNYLLLNCDGAEVRQCLDNLNNDSLRQLPGKPGTHFIDEAQMTTLNREIDSPGRAMEIHKQWKASCMLLA